MPTTPSLALLGTEAVVWQQATRLTGDATPADSIDLALLAAAIVFMVLTVAVAAVFTSDHATKRQRHSSDEGEWRRR